MTPTEGECDGVGPAEPTRHGPAASTGATPVQHHVSKVLVVDNDPTVLRIIRSLLERDGYDLTLVRSAEEALVAFSRGVPDLVLSDLQMPGMGGLELLRRIRRHPEGKLLRVVVITGADSAVETMDALNAGADEIVHKPFDLSELRVRVRNALAQKRLIDDLDRAESVLFTMARMVEARDRETRDHCDRLRRYGERFAATLGLDDGDVEALRRGAVLHDIGKIAIPDAILLAPRKLTEAEWDVMRTHPAQGEALCRGLHAAEAALPIVRSHHERWDGSGYPDALDREAIPRVARVFHILDVFDALTSKRPYKAALPTEEAIGIMRAEDAKGWYEPGLLDAWVEALHRPGRAEAGCDG